MNERNTQEHREINLTSLDQLSSYISHLNQIYYDTDQQIPKATKRSKIYDAFWAVIEESIHLGLISASRFASELSSQTSKIDSSRNDFKTTEIHLMIENSIPLNNRIQNLDTLLEWAGLNSSIFVGGSSVISKSAEDKDKIEHNALKAARTCAETDSVYINGGVGKPASLMRIGVEEYLKNGGTRYLAVVPKTYLKYELQGMIDLIDSYPNQFKVATVKTIDDRISLLNAILSQTSKQQQARKPKLIVSGAGLGTLDELFKFLVLKQNKNWDLEILNSTRYSHQLVRLLEVIGIFKGRNFTIR